MAVPFAIIVFPVKETWKKRLRRKYNGYKVRGVRIR
jgi:hypothetical protein